MRMNNVVYNASYSGFCLSKEAVDWLNNRGIHTDAYLYINSGGKLPRHHPILVECVKELGEDASTNGSELKIKPVKSIYKIDNYDGYECVIQPKDIKWTDSNNTDLENYEI